METNALWFMLFQFIENEATTFRQLTLLQSSGDIAHSVGSLGLDTSAGYNDVGNFTRNLGFVFNIQSNGQSPEKEQYTV